MATRTAAGSTDDEIALLFRRSRFRLPEGLFHHWTAIAVRAVMGEDEGGSPLNGMLRHTTPP